MKLLWLFPYYLGWHYGRAIVEMLINFKNFLFFIFNFFSIRDLFVTLFSPFQRLKEEYTGGLDVGKFLESIGVNLIMRFVGLFVRSFIIFLGILSLGITFIVECAIFLIWLILPGASIFLFIISSISLIKML